MIRFIHPTLPSPAEWLPYLDASYDAAWFSNFGPAHERFAGALTAKYGSVERITVPVASATTGLAALLMAHGVIGSVVLPSFTFPATAQAILQAGCTPLFCDVDAQTWALDAQHVRDLLARTRVGAVMPIRPYGFAGDLSKLADVCRAHGVPMLIDSAAGLGGRLADGSWAGNQGDAEVFSLHATKVFGIGEGGVVFCPPALAQRLRTALNFGIAGERVVGRGVNGKLSEFHAAIGLAMLEKIDRHIASRSRYVARYRELLAPLVDAGLIDFPLHAGQPPFQTLPLRLRADVDTEAVVAQARARDLELRRYYFPLLHTAPAFSSYAAAPLPVSTALAPRMLCLPVYSEMSDPLLDAIAAIVRDILTAH